MKHTSPENIVSFSESSKVAACQSKSMADVFRALDRDTDGKVSEADIVDVLDSQGILYSDPRLVDLRSRLKKYAGKGGMTLPEFSDAVRTRFKLIERATKERLVIPRFSGFVPEIDAIFEKTSQIKSGKVADYIPQLAKVDPENFAVSVCTVDGQRANFGSADTAFSVQSVSKLIGYALALELNGEDKVHRHVGREPSGQSFNELSLNPKHLPHNPMVNAGGIMSASLIKPDLPAAERFERVVETWQALSGGVAPNYNNSVYLSEKLTADRNFALAYFMQEMNAFPKSTDILQTLDFYFQCCSISQNTADLSTVAATFANAGVCPLTEQRVFSGNTTKNCLSLMYSCGMYDFSGEFAFTIGLPAKSGVSGVMIIVIPNIMGIAIWSPRLDELGNSVRGVEFCKELVKRFNFHTYENVSGSDDKIDPAHTAGESRNVKVFKLINAACTGDLNEIARLVAHGIDLNESDYDLRTPLHLAASEGQVAVVQYLLSQGVDADVKDRWGSTPLDDALRHNRDDVVGLLNKRAA